MRPEKLIFAGVLAALMISCNDDDSDPDQNPAGGPVTVTDVQTGKFWTDELTITGTGFSPVIEQNVVRFLNVTPSWCSINYTSDGGDIEIVSATATQLRIIVPYRIGPFGNIVCGPNVADIEITVGDNKTVSVGNKFFGLPTLGMFNYHYGWFDVPHVTRIGDSVMIDAGLLGDNPRQSPNWDKLRLSIDGTNIPIKYRTIGLESGFAFFLPVSEFGQVNCSTEPDDWAAREMEFRLSIVGTNKYAQRDLYVQYYPLQSATCHECPGTVSKSAGGDPVWKITGKNMSYNEARFVSVNCGEPSQGTSVTAGLWTDNLQFTIPLSILTAGCTYSVMLQDECRSVYIGSIAVTD